jgi:hypothetical protein
VFERALRCLSVLLLVPLLAHAQTSESQPADQGKTAPAANAPPTVPKNLGERTDFALTLTTLDALHKKGAITDEEYNAALRDMIAVGARAAGQPTFVLGRFATTFYGWLQGDFVHDTQRFGVDQYGGNPTLNVAGAAAHEGRTAFGARGTRLGVRMSAPATSSIRVTGNVEFDFLGNQPSTAGTAPRNANTTAANLSEDSYFTNATPRIRQAIVKIDTPVVAVWIGQTWDLVAFQAAFLPTSVQYQGLPGQIFGRDPQVRLSRIFDAKVFSVEAAAAMLRPAQIDSEIPDFQAGLKFNVDSWKGLQTLGATGTTTSPASVAVSGAVRKFKIANNATADQFSTVTGKAIVGDAFVPLLPATKPGTFSVAVLAEGSVGTGYADLFTGLNGGAVIGRPPGVPAPAAGTVDPFQDVDLGLVGFDRSGKLSTVDWRSLLVGVEVHGGPMILAGNFSNVYSKNIEQFSGTWRRQNFWDAALLGDVGSGVRLGIEFARTLQYRLTGQVGKDSRVFAAGFFIF